MGAAALRKAWIRLVPLIGLGYGAAYVDRVNVSFASLQMNRDLHFSASMYGLGAGLFFISYALCEVPSNMLMVKFGAKRWLARIMLTWGLLAMAMMFVRTAVAVLYDAAAAGDGGGGVLSGRGVLSDGVVSAGAQGEGDQRVLYRAAAELDRDGRLAGWLLGLNGRMGLAGWQWLFLVEGLPPILLSVVFLSVSAE